MNTTDNKPGEALACPACGNPLTALTNGFLYCHNFAKDSQNSDDWKARSCQMAQYSVELPAEAWQALSHAPLAAVGGDALRTAWNGTWPLSDVLTRLADAVEHLLQDHDCDMHGYEGLSFAVPAARWFADKASNAAAASSAPAERLTQDEQCDAFQPSILGVPEPEDRCVKVKGHEGKHSRRRMPSAPAEPLQPEGEQEREVQYADCLTWFKPDTNHTCRQQVRRNQRSMK